MTRALFLRQAFAGMVARRQVPAHVALSREPVTTELLRFQAAFDCRAAQRVGYSQMREVGQRPEFRPLRLNRKMLFHDSCLLLLEAPLLGFGGLILITYAPNSGTPTARTNARANRASPAALRARCFTLAHPLEL